MEYIYSKIDGSLLHVIYRITDALSMDEFRIDITEPKEYLQCAIMKAESGKTYAPHYHVTKGKLFTDFKVQEAFIIIYGRIMIDIFDVDNSFLEEVTLERGDLAILINGGHSVKTKQNGAIFYEIKTGPYEGQERDKVHIL